MPWSDSISFKCFLPILCTFIWSLHLLHEGRENLHFVSATLKWRGSTSTCRLILLSSTIRKLIDSSSLSWFVCGLSIDVGFGVIFLGFAISDSLGSSIGCQANAFPLGLSGKVRSGGGSSRGCTAWFWGLLVGLVTKASALGMASASADNAREVVNFFQRSIAEIIAFESLWGPILNIKLVTQ